MEKEVSENDSVPLRHQLSESNIGSNTDIRGNLRGGCKRCNCKQYSYIKERSSKCSVCRHAPAQHIQLTQKLTVPREQEDELEKDTPLFTKSRNAIPSNASSSLCITDVEEEEKTPPVPKLKPQPVKRKTYSLNPVSLINKHHPSSMSLPAAGQMDQSPHMPPVIRPRDDYVSQQQPLISMSSIAPAAANATPQPSVQQPSIPQTCKLDGCNKPVRVERSGKVHEFCCRKHALDFKSNGVPPHLKCSNPSCGRMKYKEKNGTYLDYCSKSCRDSCRRSQQQVLPVLPENTCLLPDCNKPKYFDSINSCYLDYCGKSHADEAKKNLVKKASRQEFRKILDHFTQCWDSRKGPCGQLFEVFVIDNPKLKDQFKKYHSTLSVNTINRYYHGTSLKCAIYQDGMVCSDHTCGICGVIQKGMLPNFKAKNIKFQRFGDGFYLAPNSSKCHDYTQGHNIYRAMLLFDVAEGNRYTLQNDQTGLTAPPSGYDSVYGKHGGNLNYDEIVLFKSEAVVPTHIVVYIKDGIHKIAK